MKYILIIMVSFLLLSATKNDTKRIPKGEWKLTLVLRNTDTMFCESNPQFTRKYVEKHSPDKSVAAQKIEVGFMFQTFSRGRLKTKKNKINRHLESKKGKWVKIELIGNEIRYKDHPKENAYDKFQIFKTSKKQILRLEKQIDSGLLTEEYELLK